MKLWIESDEFAARWQEVSEENMDKITGFAVRLIGEPDTVA